MSFDEYTIKGYKITKNKDTTSAYGISFLIPKETKNYQNVNKPLINTKNNQSKNKSKTIDLIKKELSRITLDFDNADKFEYMKLKLGVTSISQLEEIPLEKLNYKLNILKGS